MTRIMYQSPSKLSSQFLSSCGRCLDLPWGSPRHSLLYSLVLDSNLVGFGNSFLREIAIVVKQVAAWDEADKGKLLFDNPTYNIVRLVSYSFFLP